MADETPQATASAVPDAPRPRLFLVERGSAGAAPALRAALHTWGYEVEEGPGPGPTVLVADHPDPQFLPAEGTEILWWVAAADSEAVSAVLALRPGWVLLQDRPLLSIRSALTRLRQRDLGSDGWLRQMLRLASLDELLKLVLDRAIQRSGARGGGLWLRREGHYYQRAGDGSFPEAPLPRALAMDLIREGQAFLLAPSEALGLLRLHEPTTPPEVFLRDLADVEPLLLSAWRLEESRALSFQDDLTVAQNRRCLEAELPQAVRAAAAGNKPLALLFFDVDDLKRVNTSHGHLAGSAILEAVARSAQKLCRAHDRLYRYGGDEFCILMPSTTARGARKLGERLIQAVKAQPVDLGQTRVEVSLSAGVAAFPEHAEGALRLLEEADRALLRAKAQGKTQVMVAGE